MKKASIILGLFFALALASGARAETYRDEERHFSFEVPEGWKKGSGEDVADEMALAKAFLPETAQLVAGKAKVVMFENPAFKDSRQILLMCIGNPSKEFSPEAFHRTIRTAIERTKLQMGKLEGFQFTCNPDEVVLFSQQNRVDIPYVVSSGGVDAHVMLSYLWGDGQWVVLAYASDAAFDPVTPRAIAGSLYFAPGHEWHAAHSSIGLFTGGAAILVALVLVFGKVYLMFNPRNGSRI